MRPERGGPVRAPRRDRRLGVKRPRAELRRLHGLLLSPSVIHKVLVRHGLGALPRRARPWHKPKRYSRAVPGDRVQIDNCKIRPGLWRFRAIDDCSRYLVAGLARGQGAAAALVVLKQVLDEVPSRSSACRPTAGAEFFAEEVQRRLDGRDHQMPARSASLAAPERQSRACAADRARGALGHVDARAPDIREQLAQWMRHYCRASPSGYVAENGRVSWTGGDPAGWFGIPGRLVGEVQGGRSDQRCTAEDPGPLGKRMRGVDPAGLGAKRGGAVSVHRGRSRGAPRGTRAPIPGELPPEAHPSPASAIRLNGCSSNVLSSLGCSAPPCSRPPWNDPQAARHPRTGLVRG